MFTQASFLRRSRIGLCAHLHCVSECFRFATSEVMLCQYRLVPLFLFWFVLTCCLLTTECVLSLIFRDKAIYDDHRNTFSARMA